MVDDTGTASLTEAQRRRQFLRYCRAKGTQKALRSAVLSVAGTEESDAGRIAILLKERLESYTGPSNRLTFRAWAVEWATRAAALTALTKPLLPELATLAGTVPGLPWHEAEYVAEHLLYRLDGYAGCTDDEGAFRVWAEAATLREAESVVALASWIEQHRGAVFAGLWTFLSLPTCKDMGADQGTADELERNVWSWVSQHAEEFIADGAPIHVRLRDLGEKFAQVWMLEESRRQRRFRSFEARQYAYDRAIKHTGRVAPAPQAE